MLTQDKTISTVQYWDKIFSGKNMNAKVDSSNTVRPPKTFDRFDIVVKHAEGPNVLEVAAGHAHISKRIKTLHPDWNVLATDQSKEAMKVSKYPNYQVMSVYSIAVLGYSFNTVIATQCIEYFEFPESFMHAAKAVAGKLICTVPLGNMEKWSQLRIYEEESFIEWISKWGMVEVKENYGELLLVKIKF